MEDYEALYNHHRSKYYEACSEVNGWERSVVAWKNQRQGTINWINELEANKRRTNDAIDDLKAVLNCKGSVDEKLSLASKKLDDASANYSVMVNASDVSSKSLSDVFGEESRKTTASINDVFDKVKRRHDQLQDKLNELNAQLRNARGQLENLNAQIRSGESALHNWSVSRNNHMYNMDYYKRKMQTQAC